MDPTRRSSSSSTSHEAGATNVVNVIQAMIMGLLLIVTVGFIFLWVMQPTNVYKESWLPTIRAQINPTYFGTQGQNLLLYIFPVLFVAALGCVYLHLGEQSNRCYHPKGSSGKDGKSNAWKRPMVIKRLGIVSAIELAFLTMFIALLVWSFAVPVHNNFLQITQKSAAKEGVKVWQAKLETSAVRLGVVGNVCLAFLFFPVARGSSVLRLFGLTSEASIKYHMWVGNIAMTLFTTHGLCFIIFWSSTHQIGPQMKEWAKTGVSNAAGEVALLAGLAMWATTLPRVRRKMFELFFYTHHLYIVFVFFFALHVGITFACYSLAGFYLFMVDRYLRFLQSRENVRLVSARVLPCEAVELNFSKTRGLTYTPTSVMFLNVPCISKLQWHPYTVSSSSSLEPEKLSVIIKAEGTWSRKLHKLLSSPSNPVDHLAVAVEGPYGPTSPDYLKHDLVVMVSGGSGITPFISIIRELIYAGETLKLKTPSILLVSAFKDSSDLGMLDLILPISGSPAQLSNLDVQIEAYVTREKQPSSAEEKKSLRTVWFKPKPSDSPIAPILGENSWLWLATIMSASFVIFLLLVGIVTRYYIYPIDHGTNKIFSYSTRSVLNILFLCVSIAVVATAAFLWNKKQNASEKKQIQNLEGATPLTSPNSWYYNADREIESLPQQSLLLSTNVHYGERPDLKRILFERKESSVGVLVCGPKEMRHEVANICSSGLGANLHFESITFSW